MTSQSNNWRQNYGDWIRKVGTNAMQGSSTGPSTTPPGLVGKQQMGSPKDLSGQSPNALMEHPIGMQQMQAHQNPHQQQLNDNAIYQDVMRMFRS